MSVAGSALRRRHGAGAGATRARPFDVAGGGAGYDSDDSSLSSNASGSAQSNDHSDVVSRWASVAGAAGAATAATTTSGAREWRTRAGAGAGAARGRGGRPPHERLHVTCPYQVKYTPDDLLNGSQWDDLSQEIWDKFVTSQQTEDTFRNKMSVWRHLYITIKTMFPRYGLYVVGSTMSGFGLEQSDMDVCLYVRSAHWLDSRPLAIMHLDLVMQYIRRLHHNAQLIQAKVPILKFSDAATGVQVDLNYNNAVGIRNTNLLYYYSTLDWRVRPLVVVCKLWARAHAINDARRRTLSSYALTLMVLHFLQCGAMPAVLPCVCPRGTAWSPGRWAPAYRSRNRQSLGELFLQLLHYYAHFPYHKLAVSVRAGRALPVADCRNARALKNDPHQWKLLCVEEPFDLTNTARSVYDPEEFERIVDTFRASHSRLAACPRLAEAWPPPPPSPPAPPAP